MMHTVFEDTMTGLLQAMSIEKDTILVKKVYGMPSETYRVENDELPQYSIIYSPKGNQSSAKKIMETLDK